MTETQRMKDYMETIYEKPHKAKKKAARATPADQEPIAYLHTLHTDGDQGIELLTFDAENAFGEPGRDYSAEYQVTRESLFTQAPQPEAQSVRVAERVPRIETQDYFVRLVERYGMAMWESRNDEAVRLKIELCTRYGDLARRAALKSATPQKPVSDEVKP